MIRFISSKPSCSFRLPKLSFANGLSSNAHILISEEQQQEKQRLPSTPKIFGSLTVLRQNQPGGVFILGNSRSFSTTSSRAQKQNDDGTPLFKESTLDESTFASIESMMPPSEAVSSTTTTAAMESFERIGWPSDYMIDTILQINNFTGCGIAYSIIGFTLGFRLLLVPLNIKAQRNSSRMAHLKPEMDLLKKTIERQANQDPEANLRLSKQMTSLFQKYDCHPAFGLVLPLIQMPVFMSMFFALQRLPELFPVALKTEGLLWFPDLGAADPYYMLPVLTAGSFFLTIESSKEAMLASGEQGKTMMNVMRGMALLMIPFTLSFPSAMFVYWLPNNLFSLSSAVILKQPVIKKLFGIWDPPKPPPGTMQPKSLVEQLQDSFRQQGDDTSMTRRNQNLERMNLERAEAARVKQKLRLSKIRGVPKKKI